MSRSASRLSTLDSKDKLLVKGLHSAYVEPLRCLLFNTLNISVEKNSQWQLQFTVYDDGSLAFHMLSVEASVWWDGQEYIVKQFQEADTSGFTTYQITAIHVAYDVQRVRQRQVKTGTLTYTVESVLSFYLAGNSFGYTWQVIGSFGKEQITDLGNSSGKDMLDKIVSTWPDAIFYPDNKNIRIYQHDSLAKNLGNRIDYLHNTPELKLTYDSSSIVNQVMASGKTKENTSGNSDKTEYYFKPFLVTDQASVNEWGLHPGDDVSDERFTDKKAMQAYALSQLTPQPTLVIDVSELVNEEPTLGEIRRLENRKDGFVTEVEVVAFTFYPLDKSQATSVTLNDQAKTILNYKSKQQSALQKALQKQSISITKAANTAKVAYSSRLAGHKVIETEPEILTKAEVATKTTPTFQLYVPDKNSGFEGLEAGDKFYPFIPAKKIDGLNEMIQEIIKKAIAAIPEPEVKSVLYGKTMNIIGDSYVSNNGQPITDTWHYKVASKNKMVYRNYGINGNCLVADGGSGTKVIDRFDEMDNDADYILVVGGKNDYNQQMAISEFSTQLASLIKKVVQKYQGKHVCFFTPWPDQGPAIVNPIALHEYANAIEEQCSLLGVPCFNSSKYSGIATYNAQFRAKYFQTADDVSHLNAAGHDLFVNKAQKFLESL